MIRVSTPSRRSEAYLNPLTRAYLRLRCWMDPTWPSPKKVAEELWWWSQSRRRTPGFPKPTARQLRNSRVRHMVHTYGDNWTRAQAQRHYGQPKKASR